MNWQEICSYPNLQNLPFKIELNQQGQIIMSPAKLYHGAFQSEISYLIKRLQHHGKIVVECAVRTKHGTKVADVAWFSQERWEQVKDEFESPVAPEICVEIVSESNTREELFHKKRLYFEKGAREFWLCEKNGKMKFHDHRKGEISASLLVPEFPEMIEI
ncbi:Uma2 family endonuclease [Desulfonema magnum]|uniref:DUF820 n=1 Tax=Desulfonema magnum TaxID=45655 RepID=A0A975BMF1_9BACT|nr:Uma2 family endonuclease [Desulfonema magnum]QTA87932.1 DUF820 [Desulfonema magnum]